MSNDDGKTTISYFCPACKVKNCDGLLKFEINDENMCVDYVCGKNRDHNGNNINFKIFENFYLKEKKEKIYKCSKCSSLLYTNKIYKCKECKNIYCENCFNSDEHINNDINNLIYIEENDKKNKNIDKRCYKCNKHISFCFDCIQNVCVYCSNYHKKHKTISLISLSHSSNSINYLIELIEEKSKINENCISSIDKWLIDLNKRIDTLKQKFKDQISLLKKMVLNFSPFITDPIYSINFWNLFYSLKNIKKDYLEKLKGSYGFEQQSKHIMNLLLKKELKVEKKIGLINVNNIKSTSDKVILHKINNRTYLAYEPYNYLKQNQNFGIHTIDDEYNIILKDDICSISNSLDKKEIYVCLSKKKIVKIISCDLELLKINLTNIEIIGISNKYEDHYNQCIQISSEYLATANDNIINIWSKVKYDNRQEIEYINIFNITEHSNIFDLFYVNEKYFISFQPDNKTISFINTNMLKQDTTLSNDKFSFYDMKNSILVLKDYITVNCTYGIAFIYIKTKEIVQFIENKYRKYICLDNLDSFYIITYVNNNTKKQDIFINDIGDFNFINDDLRLILWGTIEKYKLINGSYEMIENYEEIYTYNNPQTIDFIYINNGFVFDIYKYFVLEEINNTEVKFNFNKNMVYKVLIKKK